MSATQPLLNPGTILAGRWQIQDFIGNGETGEVYGVRDMHSTGTFALKLFWPNALSQPEIWSALQQTARTASGLGVEGVARAYDFGIDANAARPFFVAERVSWSSLADRVRVRGPLTPAEASSALGVLARALDAAHGVGLVHRDLKPENVFVSPENAHWVRITDFGVALLRSATPPPPGWGGTIGWVAPEAADPNARSSPAMDIFSLGLITFFALSGGHLHRAARTNPIDPSALWQELGAPLDSASTRARELGTLIDPAFDAWFQRAVAASPQARFSSVGEMASAFEGVARGLIAPQSQSAVALQGVAAAIAQPLIFQPESPPPVLGSATVADFGAAAQFAPPPESVASDSGSKKRNSAPLFIGGAVLVFALTGVGAFGLYQHRRSLADTATAEAAASASAAASAATTAAAAVSAAATAAAPSVASTEPAPAASPAEPTPSTAVAAAPAPAPAPSSAALVAAKPAITTAKPSSPASAKPASTASAKPAVVAVAQTKPTVAVANAKPSPTVVSAKPSVSAKVAAPKKKCGSVFIPCK